MPAAVIGARGFLGRALVPALRSSGVPAAEFTRATPFLSEGGAAAPGLAAAGTVYYLASTINPAIAERDPDAVATDRQRFASFLEALARLDRPPRVVLPSSGGTVYDPAAPPPYAETAPTRPGGRYGAAKLELEDALLGSGLPAVVLRISNAYGPGQPTGTGQGVVAHWLAAAAKAEPILVYGDPAASRDYVYVSDVADALVLAGSGDVTGVVNVGSGVPTSLETLLELVREVTGALEVQRTPGRGFDVAHTWLDVRRASVELGWTARTALREGLRATWLSGPSGSGPAGPR